MSTALRPYKPTVLLVMTLLLAAAGCGEKHPEAVATPPPVVEVAQPVERTVTDYQVFTARTQAVQSVDIKARVTGYLTKISFTDGDLVKKGDVLFQIDDRPYKAALDQAKAGVELARGALARANAALEVAKAALVKTQAEYEIGLNVQKNNPGAISPQELTKRLGARDEAKGGIDQAKATIEEARGSVAQANAALASAELNYDWCKVTAPISGRANTHFLDVGNLVSQNLTTLTNIVSLKPTWAYFYVDENTLLNFQQIVREGKIQAPRKDALPVQMSLVAGKGEPVEGTIDFISNQVDPNTGSLRVRAVFANENGDLIAGLFGRIRAPISAEHKALLVADSAIGTNQGQRFVYVVNDQNEVEYRAVDVGQMHGGLREVRRFREVTDTGPDGRGVLKRVEVLKPTDLVIVDGLQRARPGAKVRPRRVDMITRLVGREAPKKQSSGGR